MKNLSTIDEVQNLWKELTQEEQEKVEHLLPVVSGILRVEADKVGKDIDAMIESGEIPQPVVDSVVTDIIRRYINSSKDESAPKTQFAEAALGYSVSGTYLVSGEECLLRKTNSKGLA